MIAVVAAAKGSWLLIIFGIGISVPLIIFGTTLVMWLIERFPLFIWIGAALLGWIAGEMLVDDRLVLQTLAGNPGLVTSVPVSLDNPIGLKPSGFGALHSRGDRHDRDRGHRISVAAPGRATRR